MAFVPTKQIPEEEQNKFASEAPTTSNPTPAQSGGSVGAEGGQASPAGQAKGTPPGAGSSTQFGSNAAKLSDYLTVNQPKIESFGNKIAGNLSQNYNQTMGNIDKGFGAFNQQVQQGIPSTQNSGNRASGNLSNGNNAQVPSANSDYLSQAAANPTAFVKNPENVSKFQQAYQGNYTGPSNIESTEPYQGLNNEVNQAVQDAGLVGSTSGLGAYLNTKMGGQNQETQGMQTLDTALLQGNPAAQQSIKAAAQPFQNLQSYLSGQTQQANSAAQNAKNTAAQTAAQYQDQFTGKGGIIPTFQNDLTSRLGAASTSASTAANRAKADLLAGKVTPEDMKLLGIDKYQLSDISNPMKSLQSDYGQNFDLGNYATIQDPSAVFANPNAIATSDDYARAAALAQLTGSDFSPYLDQSMAGNAGKQNNALLGFNATGAQADANTALKQSDMGLFNKALTNPTFAKNYGAATVEDILSNKNHAADQARSVLSPEEQKIFDSALFRYRTQWAPTPPAPPPVPVQPGQPPPTLGFRDPPPTPPPPPGYTPAVPWPTGTLGKGTLSPGTVGFRNPGPGIY